MNDNSVRVERRLTQRFDYTIPVSVRRVGSEREGCGFTQNLSGRGVLFYTDFPLCEGDQVELTLAMPSEITLTETMRVRCRGKVMRMLPPAGGSVCGVAVHLEGYEFLPDAEVVAKSSVTFERVSTLHGHDSEKEAAGVGAPAFHPRTAALP